MKILTRDEAVGEVGPFFILKRPCHQPNGGSAGRDELLGSSGLKRMNGEGRTEEATNSSPLVDGEGACDAWSGFFTCCLYLRFLVGLIHVSHFIFRDVLGLMISLSMKIDFAALS